MVVHSHAVILMLLSLFPESFGIFSVRLQPKPSQVKSKTGCKSATALPILLILFSFNCYFLHYILLQFALYLLLFCRYMQHFYAVNCNNVASDFTTLAVKIDTKSSV